VLCNGDGVLNTARLHHQSNAAQELTVILNARARGVDAERIEDVKRAFEEARVPVRFELVCDGADLADRAARFARRDRVIVAAGGDGTASAVASAAVETGAIFGVIPLGTLNHFARDVGIPPNVEDAAKVVAAGYVRHLDVGDVNGRIFLNNASVGLYPRLVWEREREQRHGRAKWTAFGIALVRTWRRYRTLVVRLTVDGREHTRRTPFVFVGNNEYVAEGLHLGARDRLDRGRLSLYVAPRRGRFEILALPFQAVAGRLSADEKFESFLAGDVSIETARSRISVALDGEVAVLAPPLQCRTRPGVLRTIVPAPS
jgi:diacylglycerol kinase family enzyme